MKRFLGQLALCATVIGGTTPLQAETAQAPAKSTCEVLSGQWRASEIALAQAYAQGIADTSVPRASMRATEVANALATAGLALTLMKEHKCPLPKRAPSELAYATGALSCETERLKGNYKSEQCDTTKWTSIYGD